MRAPLSLFANTLYKISLTKVDLPEPLTPVTETKTPNGTSTSMSFKLFSLAPLTVSFLFASSGRRLLGIAIDLRPLKYAPVMDSLESIRDW